LKTKDRLEIVVTLSMKIDVNIGIGVIIMVKAIMLTAGTALVGRNGSSVRIKQSV
jgi:hypothetical protein